MTSAAVTPNCPYAVTIDDSMGNSAEHKKKNNNDASSPNSQVTTTSSISTTVSTASPSREQDNASAQTPGTSSSSSSPSFWDDTKARVNVSFLLSILVVSCWSSAGNASRIALHSAFVKIPFFASTYEYFGPNCLGCFAIAFVAAAFPAESELPLFQRALAVGFCGSFTTLSSWVENVVNKSTAADSFEELISGLTMPFIFCVLGRDMGQFVGKWIGAAPKRKKSNTVDKGDAGSSSSSSGVAQKQQDEEENDNQKQQQYQRYLSHRGNILKIIDYIWLILSCAAAIAIPIALQVRINQGHIHSFSSTDIKAVVVGPAGAVLRYLLGVFLNKRPQFANGFPVGTLAANTLGVFLVVFMDNYSHHHPQNEWFLIVSSGICGALSTVSSFINESVTFYSSGRRLMCYAYIAVTLAVTITIGAIGRSSNFD